MHIRKKSLIRKHFSNATGKRSRNFDGGWLSAKLSPQRVAGGSLRVRCASCCCLDVNPNYLPCQQLEESRAMRDLNARIRQLTKLILTSQTVDETKGDESRPASPSKVDFDMTPYQVGLCAVLLPSSSHTHV